MIKLVQLETCESTNDEAWKHLPEATLVLARAQSRGRGRQGRSWQDDDGNIMASLALVPEPGLDAHFLWAPLAAGVAACEAIELVAGRTLSGLRLKWPNDVMWQKAKMGGILCESRITGDRISGVVIGFGLNLARAPHVPDTLTSALADHVAVNDDMRVRIVSHWADRLQYWLAELAQGRTARLRETWLQYAKLETFSEFTAHDRAGQTVKLKALDLDEQGRLKASPEANDSKIIYLDQAP